MEKLGIIVMFVASLILFGIGMMFLTLGSSKRKNIDYSKCKKSVGMNLGDIIHKCSHRVIVFTNEKGEKSYGFDDMFCESTFHPERYNMPKKGIEYEIYYYDYDWNSTYYLSGGKIEYWIHFCDESLYELNRQRGKRHIIVSKMIGAAFIIASIFNLYKGIMSLS